MPQDFSGQNLRGRSFKGQDLSEANFAGADIRGANFSNALLIGADFRGAKAGLQRRWVVGLLVCSWLLAGLSGFLSLFASAFLHELAGFKVSSTAVEQPKPITTSEFLLQTAQVLVEMERKLETIETDMQIIQGVVDEVKQIQKSANENLYSVDTPIIEIAEKTTRAELSTIIRSYCVANHASYSDAWNKLYSEFRDLKTILGKNSKLVKLKIVSD